MIWQLRLSSSGGARWLVALAAGLLGCGAGPAPAPADAALKLVPPPTLVAPSLPAPGRVVYDLLDNRPLAHVRVDENLVIEAGGVGFWKYVDGGWKSSWYPLARDGERRVALVQGTSAAIRFPFDALAPAGASARGALPDRRDPSTGPPAPPHDDGAGDLRVAFTVRPAVPQQTVTLLLDERPVGNLTLADGYHTYEVTLPTARLPAGEVSLRFHFRAAGTLAGKHTAAAFERIVIGPRPSAPGRSAAAADAPTPGHAAPAVRFDDPYGVGGETRRALSASVPARFSWYLQIPPGARLELACGTRESTNYEHPDAGVRFAVRAALDCEGPECAAPGRPARSRHLREVELWSARGRRGWQPAHIDLAPVAGRAVRLDLVIAGGEGAFAAPRLVADAPPAARPAGRAAEHVLVWIVDSLRADRLAAWNPASRVKTPGFDQLGREGARFLRTTVQGNDTLPSHASLLTGTYPAVHHMLADPDRLSPALPLVSESFKKAGFATALFSADGYVSDKGGFRRGFGHYRNLPRENLPSSAEALWSAARPWLARQVKEGKRTFLYLATIDPHVPYDPPERFLRQYFSGPYRGPIKPASTSDQLNQIRLGRLHLSDEDRRYLEALYDAEVTQNDAALLQVVADLKQLGIYDTTAIVVVSDHGDELFDHGSVGHGHSVWQELVDVPLLVRYPPLVPADRAVTTGAEAVDVLATLLDLAGLDPSPASQGESLLPLAWDGGPRMERPGQALHGAEVRSLRLGRFKLVHWGGARLALYDLDADRQERKDLASSRPLALRSLRDVFSLSHAYQAGWHAARWGIASALQPAFTVDAGDQ